MVAAWPVRVAATTLVARQGLPERPEERLADLEEQRVQAKRALAALQATLVGQLAPLSWAAQEAVRSLVLVCTWAKCDEFARGIFRHFAAARAAMAPFDFIELLQLWIWAPSHWQTNAADLGQDRAGAAVAAATGLDSEWMAVATCTTGRR